MFRHFRTLLDSLAGAIFDFDAHQDEEAYFPGHTGEIKGEIANYGLFGNVFLRLAALNRITSISSMISSWRRALD